MEKGQGALEYLLIIGGAALVVLIVILILYNIEQQSEEEVGLSFSLFDDIIKDFTGEEVGSTAPNEDCQAGEACIDITLKPASA